MGSADIRWVDQGRPKWSERACHLGEEHSTQKEEQVPRPKGRSELSLQKNRRWARLLEWSGLGKERRQMTTAVAVKAWQTKIRTLVLILNMMGNHCRILRKEITCFHVFKGSLWSKLRGRWAKGGSKVTR